MAFLQYVGDSLKDVVGAILLTDVLVGGYLAYKANSKDPKDHNWFRQQTEKCFGCKSKLTAGGVACLAFGTPFSLAKGIVNDISGAVTGNTVHLGTDIQTGVILGATVLNFGLAIEAGVASLLFTSFVDTSALWGIIAPAAAVAGTNVLLLSRDATTSC